MKNDMFLGDEIILLLGKTSAMKSGNMVSHLATNKSTEKNMFFYQELYILCPD